MSSQACIHAFPDTIEFAGMTCVSRHAHMRFNAFPVFPGMLMCLLYASLFLGMFMRSQACRCVPRLAHVFQGM